MLTHLQRTGTLLVNAPIVVEVEADQPQDCDVEENIPTRNQTAVPIHPLTKLHQLGVLPPGLDPVMLHVRRGNMQRQPPVPISMAKLVREQRADIERPGAVRNILPRHFRGDLVVDPQNDQDLECRESMERNEEDIGKSVIKRDALFQAARTALVSSTGAREQGIPASSEERVEDQEQADVGKVASKCTVLRVRHVNLSTRYPSISEVSLKSGVPRIRC